ncbi:MAG: hypothetical protein ABI605_17100 [Rhizobacter sp.]
MGDLTEPALHLRHLCDELKRHGQCAPHDGARDALESALLSKWEGVRVAAVQALCAWGDEASVRAVQSTLSGLAGKPHRWAAVGAMAQALFPHLTDDDQDWAIRLYFLESHPDNRFVLQILFEAFEPRQLLVRLKLEAARSGGARVATDLQQAVARAERRISVTRKEH